MPVKSEFTDIENVKRRQKESIKRTEEVRMQDDMSLNELNKTLHEQRQESHINTLDEWRKTQDKERRKRHDRIKSLDEILDEMTKSLDERRKVDEERKRLDYRIKSQDEILDEMTKSLDERRKRLDEETKRKEEEKEGIKSEKLEEPFIRRLRTLLARFEKHNAPSQSEIASSGILSTHVQPSLDPCYDTAKDTVVSGLNSLTLETLPQSNSVEIDTVAQKSRDSSPYDALSEHHEAISMGDSGALSSDMESSSDYETDDDSELDSRELTLPFIISRIKGQIIDRVMTHFSELFENQQKFQSRMRNNTDQREEGSSSSQNCTPNRPSGSTASSGIGSTSKKRVLNDGTSQGSNEPEDNDKGKRVKKSLPLPRNSQLNIKFACPFYKRDPEKHQKWRSCKGPGWDEVRRVKDHVYRRHSKPILCPRCSEEFSSHEGLESHIQEETRCPRRESEPLECCNKDQEKQLRSRKRPQGQTEEDRWKEMYRILFPNDLEESIPSPYYDAPTLKPGDIEDFERYDNYLRSNLSQLVRQRVEELLEAKYGTIEESLREDLVEIVRNCQDEVLQQLRADHNKSIPPNPTCEGSYLMPVTDGTALTNSNQEAGPFSAWLLPPMMSEEISIPTLGDIQNTVMGLQPEMGSDVGSYECGSIQNQAPDSFNEMFISPEYFDFQLPEDDQSHSN